MPSNDDAVLHGRSLTPRHERGELVGLEVKGERIPFPGCGLETELGVVVPGAGGQVQPALKRLLGRRRGLPAESVDRTPTASWAESDRMFDRWGSSYREGDHLEINTWYQRSARAARWNLEGLMDEAGSLADAGDEEILLHGTGGDGQGKSWSSLHVNVGLSRRGYERLLRSQRCGTLAYDYYLPAQITLAVVDGNGGVGDRGFLISDRLPEFDGVFGAGTMRPSRSMVVDRADFFGNCRWMHMLRALSFGRASTAGLAATQLDTLMVDLAVHGVLELPATPIGDPVRAAAQLARVEHVHEAAAIQRRIQGLRHQALDALERTLGAEVLDTLLPDLREELDFIDRTLDAVLADDEAEMLQRCDWARKRSLLQEFCRLRGGEVHTLREQLLVLNACYARLGRDALRHRFEHAALPPGSRVDPVPADTSSWFLHSLCVKAEDDRGWREDLESAHLSWKGIERSSSSWAEPAGGYWPWVRRAEESIDLVPWAFTRRTDGDLLAAATSLDDLFEALGTRRETHGDYSGRAYGARGSVR